MVTLRPATPQDIESLTSIYNHAVLHTTATFDTEERTLREQKEWYEAHGPSHPILVAERDGRIMGWGSLKAWSPRKAYSKTVENSLYLHPSYWKQGMGTLLLEALINEAYRLEHHTIIARIADGNEVSLSLHKKFGFQMIGVMKEVGEKFDRLLDVHLMQLILNK